MNLLKNRFLLLNYILIFTICGCKVYSFTGASISPEIKTISVSYFPNHASIVQPSLSQIITEKLKEKFISQSGLRVIDTDGDLDFEGRITNYTTNPINIQGNETAAQNRLTIAIQVKFVNKSEPKNNFETSFSRYADYDSNSNLISVEDELITKISDQLIDDIFNKAVINW